MGCGGCPSNRTGISPTIQSFATDRDFRSTGIGVDELNLENLLRVEVNDDRRGLF